jgi:hypothetical protein
MSTCSKNMSLSTQLVAMNPPVGWSPMALIVSVEGSVKESELLVEGSVKGSELLVEGP